MGSVPRLYNFDFDMSELISQWEVSSLTNKQVSKEEEKFTLFSAAARQLVNKE
jgi:hypothetical protein